MDIQKALDQQHKKKCKTYFYKKPNFEPVCNLNNHENFSKTFLTIYHSHQTEPYITIIPANFFYRKWFIIQNKMFTVKKSLNILPADTAIMSLSFTSRTRLSSGSLDEERQSRPTCKLQVFIVSG